MYAETFRVQGWLETPAKWLRWAMQSLTARKLDDVRYNLGQFWTALAAAKVQAVSQLQWADILTLDSQSQWTLGNLYQNDQSDQLKSLNGLMTSRNIVVPFSAPEILGAAVTYFATETAVIRSKIASLGEGAGAAFKAQISLANQAAEAYRKAGNTNNQATNSATVGGYASTGNASNTAEALRQAGNMEKVPSLADLLSGDFFGLPVWAWLGGAATIALLVVTAPTVLMASQVVRKATA